LDEKRRFDWGATGSQPSGHLAPALGVRTSLNQSPR
jgi:hypothetical protein